MLIYFQINNFQRVRISLFIEFLIWFSQHIIIKIYYYVITTLLQACYLSWLP